MRADLILLSVAYILSQFFRAFLAVLAKPLGEDIGVSAQELASASGLWFLAFAVMQIPVGWALDHIGPRRTASVLLLAGGGGGALMFALATGAFHINIAMVLIGIGCAPVLMASYYIFAQTFDPARFATLAAVMIGVGSLGNLGAAYPLGFAAELVGWRAALGGLAVLTGAVAIGLWIIVRDPPKVAHEEKGSVLDLFKMPVLWFVFIMLFVNYAAAAGIRGLWIGPYLSDVFGADTAAIGAATMVMGVAMILGSFAYGPLDRIVGSRKWVAFGGNLLGALSCAALALWTDDGMVMAVALIAAVGFFGGSYPVLVAHGRQFIPPHLTGRGVTLLNLFSIAGAGVMQSLSGRIFDGFATGGVVAGYAGLFGFFAALLGAGLLVYAFAREA